MSKKKTHSKHSGSRKLTASRKSGLTQKRRTAPKPGRLLRFLLGRRKRSSAHARLINEQEEDFAEGEERLVLLFLILILFFLFFQLSYFFNVFLPNILTLDSFLQS